MPAVRSFFATRHVALIASWLAMALSLAACGGSGEAPPANASTGAFVATGGARAKAMALGDGAMSAVVGSAGVTADLSVVGSADWVHWGDGVPGAVRKAAGGNAIGGYTLVAGGTPVAFANSPHALSWQGGAPTAIATNSRSGLYLAGSGYVLTVPAGTEARTVTLYLGGWNAGATLTARLSDGSASDFSDVVATTSAQFVRTYAITYRAGLPGQTLTLTWARSAGTGNVDLNAVALSTPATAPLPPPTSTTAITPQAPVLTAPAAQVGAVGQPVALQLRASDANGDVLSYAASNLPPGLAVDAASGLISGTPTTAGTYVAAASVSDGTGNRVTLRFTWTIQPAAGGALSAVVDASVSPVNLSAVGTGDWAHWGDGVPGLLRKATGGSLIADYTLPAGGPAAAYANDPRPLAWSDGPAGATAITTGNTRGVWVAGQGKGFSTSVPADTTSRTVTVYVGGYASSGTLQAQLSDGSAAAYTNTTAAVTTQYVRGYTLTYRAASAGQRLTIGWSQASAGGNVTLNGVALSALPSVNRPPLVTAPAAQTSAVGQAIALPIAATDPDADPLSFSATGLPEGLSINATSGVVSGTPRTAGSYQPVVAVTDGRGGTTTVNFGWAIQAVASSPPVSAAGLDARPSNTSCVAPARPQPGTGVQLARVFPNLVFNLPVGMVQAPADNSRWFVIEQQTGLVRSFPNNAAALPAQVSTFLNLSARIQPDSEMGLLGLAFHPQWPATPQVYVYYSVAGTNPVENRVSRFTSSNGGLTLDAGSEQVVLRLVKNQPDLNHNGGHIAFGPDGYLYIGTGDGGGGGDPNGNSQNRNVLFGKMLRIDVSPASGYAIPGGAAGNPFAGNAQCTNGRGSAACPEIFAYGLRNPWRWSFDRSTGDLWVGDVGQDAREEIDVVRRGANHGWRTREASLCYSPGSNCATTGASGEPLVDPVVEYGRDVGAAVTGGYVYRGTRLPALVGRYVFADYVTSRVFSFLPPASLAAATPRVVLSPADAMLTAPQNVTSLAQGNDGELYVVGYGGQLYTFQAATAAVDTIPALLSRTGCVATDATQPASGLVPFTVNAPFWSDAAAKQRWLAVPNGSTITPLTPGRWGLPGGTVLMKNFRLNNQLVETRLLMRHPDGVWAGYTYEWNSTQTDATRVVGGKSKVVGSQTWIYPSENDCLRCHTDVAGRTLGLETAQLNGNFTYPTTGRNAHQITTLNAIGMLSPALTGTPASLPALVDPAGTAGTVEQRARAFLHSNCSQCHQPNGPTPVALDLRYTATLAQTGACNVAPIAGDLGLPSARLIAPGAPDSSVLLARINRRDAQAMPPLGSTVVDTASVALLRQWIQGLTGCQ